MPIILYYIMCHLKLSKSFAFFTSNVTNVQILNSIQEALDVMEWMKVVYYVMNAFEKNQT